MVITLLGNEGVATELMRMEMLKGRTVIAVLSAIVLCAALGRLTAEEPDTEYRLPKGTRAIAFHLHKDEVVPRDAANGMQVDIIGEISTPIKTSIALLSVKLLAYDPKCEGKEQAVTVQLTPAQEEVLALMQKYATKLGMKLHDKDKPKP